LSWIALGPCLVKACDNWKEKAASVREKLNPTWVRRKAGFPFIVKLRYKAGTPSVGTSMLKLSPAQSQHVNDSCACTSLDRAALTEALRTQLEPALCEQLPETHPYLFSDTPVYVSHVDIEAMLETVAAIERVAATAQYGEIVAARSAEIAGRDFGPRGAFMGYDFHLSDQGPRLIEINTNAGGAFLNGVACDAQRLCCAEMQEIGRIACPEDLSVRLAEMFRAEWRLQRSGEAPELIAIVDDRPEEQYLHPEFLLAKALLEAHGLPTVIADPSSFTHHSGGLWLGDKPVDLVYNRLVDFDLSEPRHAALRSAYTAGDAVVTPNPHHHAWLADKRNLVTLTDEADIERLGVSAEDRATLGRIPRTQLVTPERADELWARRGELFFKPTGGHGGKAVYRGDKLTRKVWATILEGGYVAQERIAPSERVIALGGERTMHKVDVRLYTYRASLLLAAARLYQGQTTNFRTPGGGFAPVMVV
jgi:hypothetical protein